MPRQEPACRPAMLRLMLLQTISSAMVKRVRRQVENLLHVTEGRLQTYATLLFSFVLAMRALAIYADEPPTEANPAADPPDPKAIEFFESRIRPILADRCLECHGPEKQKGNLRLDSLAGVLKGGDSGPTVVPNKPDESLLVQVIGYTFDIKMPPKSKLPEREIADLTQWVKRGAPWPNSDAAANGTKRIAAGEITAEQRAFWAFQPPVE